ncbi:hypothetical protein CRG98_038688 [Punica granatum]|uniref:Uncharacterized protein n=1 Tax=Punica granatum TaxID=22663 RepID=A0A2I0IAX4_PUNGR|nr:hypothetical protein CRG98_038688 [Punica granatum]
MQATFSSGGVTLSRRGQETECGIPYQNERKIDLRLINANDILILKICMMHACGNVNAHDLINVTRYMSLEMEKDSEWHAGRLQRLLQKSWWRLAWSTCRMHGFSATRTVLCKDGGSRLKGINSLKSDGDLWGPNRRSNRATYPYSEPLSNLCFLISAVECDPLVPKASMICTVCAGNKCAKSMNQSPSCAHLNFNIVGARMCTPNATRLGSVHLPGGARRTHVRRSRHYLFTTRRSRAGELPESRGM